MTPKWLKALRGWTQDELDAAPYEHLGADGPARLTELGGALVVKAVTAGAFPRDLMGRG